MAEQTGKRSVTLPDIAATRVDAHPVARESERDTYVSNRRDDSRTGIGSIRESVEGRVLGQDFAYFGGDQHCQGPGIVDLGKPRAIGSKKERAGP